MNENSEKTMHDGSSSKRKHVRILSTGGTIAGKETGTQSGQYKAGALSVEEILPGIPQIQDLAELSLIEVCSKDSNDISREDLYRIKELAEEAQQDPTVDGIVITHGTDTLEETAFFLNLVLRVSKPIVMTGAMRPATATSADGPMNLYQAVALAADPAAENMGVLAVLSDTVYSGRDLTKVNSIKTDAFEIGDPGPIGYMKNETPYLIHAPYRKHTTSSCFSGPRSDKEAKTEILYIHSETDPELVRYMLHNYDGLVIAGSGSGNYSRKVQDVIEEEADHCVVVRASRLLEGSAFDSDAFDPDRKTIPAHRLSPHKARILLELALQKGMNREEIRRLYQEY